MRLFVSIDVPDELREALADVQDEFAAGEDVRLTDPAQAHLTLSFLGDVEETRVEDIERELEGAVDDAGVAPFEMELGGLGVFPSLDYISVVWTGVREGADSVSTLQAAVEERLETLGFEGDDHEFTPHVTLARVDGHRGKELIQRAVEERDPDVGRFEVSEVRLTESTLTEGGPEYRTVSSVGL